MRHAMSADEARALRESTTLTRPKWAAALGVHAVTVLRWEKGERGIPPHTANLIRRVAAERHASAA